LSRKPIYLDCHSTTPVDPRVLQAMLPYFTERFGNAASKTHAFGSQALEGVEVAREQVAASLAANDGCDAKEIVFTSGATEANNLAIKGVAEMYRRDGLHLITTNAEHKAVLDAVRHLERNGFEATYLPVDATGRVSADQVRRAIRTGEKGTTQRTILISVMAANNEVGSVNPIAEIGRVVAEVRRAAGDVNPVFHCDAVQAIGKVPFDVRAMGVHLASVTAHKVYGPKGIGALYVRRSDPRVKLAAQIHGGGHERGLRSGTLPVPQIVGFGEALRIACVEREAEAARLSRLRDGLHRGLVSALNDCRLNGCDLDEPGARLPGNLNISIGGVKAETLMLELPEIAVSSGSACSSASLEPSHVLKAMGVPDSVAHAALRFGLGRFTTQEEIDYTVDAVIGTARKLRAAASRFTATGLEVEAVGCRL